MASASRTIAFFGATGGCAAACLVLTLQAGYQAIALVRRPAKLREILAARGIDHDHARLQIIQGDVRDVAAVEQTLSTNSKSVDTVICGIGGVPKPQFSLMTPLTLTEQRICELATKNTLQAIRNLNIHPLVCVLSSIGVAPYCDFPLLYTPLLVWLLKGPFDDKRAAHEALVASDERYVSVRLTVLLDGKSLGLGRVREGIDEQAAIGWSITRDDVGLWMFEKLVKGEGKGYVGHNVTITG